MFFLEKYIMDDAYYTQYNGFYPYIISDTSWKIYSEVLHENGINKKFKNISPQSLRDMSIAPSV